MNYSYYPIPFNENISELSDCELNEIAETWFTEGWQKHARAMGINLDELAFIETPRQYLAFLTLTLDPTYYEFFQGFI